MNEKVKRRRSSLVSTKYSSTIHQQAAASLRQNQMLISSGKTSRRIKKLFNLSGKNKRANARTFAQHMKTLNMVSVYLLVQPTSKSGGEGGEGASASSAPRGSTGDNNNNNNTSNKQHNVISTGESGVLNSSEQESNSETTKTGVVVPRTFKNSLSFEIRRVDGQVLMVDEVDEDDDDDYRQQQIEPTVMARNSSDKERFLGVDEVFSNGAISSSFNSTASSHIIDSPVCVSVAVSPSDNDVVKGQSLFCGCQSTADDNKLNQARSKKQICASLENNSLLEEKSIYSSLFFSLFLFFLICVQVNKNIF